MECNLPSNLLFIPIELYPLNNKLLFLVIAIKNFYWRKEILFYFIKFNKSKAKYRLFRIFLISRTASQILIYI